jgi:hypothetical protein
MLIILRVAQPEHFQSAFRRVTERMTIVAAIEHSVIHVMIIVMISDGPNVSQPTYTSYELRWQRQASLIELILLRALQKVAVRT